MPPNKKAKGADSQVECDSNDVSVWRCPVSLVS
jgi:hypothetical protein